MSNAKWYLRTVRFRDKNLNLWDITIEVRPAQLCRQINGKWERYDGPLEASFTGEGGISSGQCDDHIEPRTASQEKLKDYWSKYHCVCSNREALPSNYSELFDNLCNEIEADEAEYTNTLEKVFDMGDENFEATEDIISKVEEIRECDEAEAKAFIALGIHLGCTFGDLDETFEVKDWRECRYDAFGIEYYIGTDSKLEQVAEEYLDNGGYDDVWREAVRAEETELGLKDWCQQILDMDGWCHILNHCDGKYEEYQVGNDSICVSRY